MELSQEGKNVVEAFRQCIEFAEEQSKKGELRYALLLLELTRDISDSWETLNMQIAFEMSMKEKLM